jgi:hypothetical protein
MRDRANGAPSPLPSNSDESRQTDSLDSRPSQRNGPSSLFAEAIHSIRLHQVGRISRSRLFCFCFCFCFCFRFRFRCVVITTDMSMCMQGLVGTVHNLRRGAVDVRLIIIIQRSGLPLDWLFF